MLAVDHVLKRLRTGAQICGRVSRIDCWADDTDLQAAHQVALADAGITQAPLPARIGPNQQDRIGLFDAGDRRVEQVTRTGGGIKNSAILAAVQVLGTEASTRSFSATIDSASARSPASAAIRSPERP